MNLQDGSAHMDLSIKKYDVFITYRRSDGLSHAQLLYQALVKRGF